MPTSDFELSAFLPYRLAVLSERVSRRLSLVYEKAYGLTVAEWRVLVHLNRCEKVSVREIHNCVNLEKSRVSRAVSRLEDAGFVSKVSDESDGRLVEISLSEQGRSVLEEILPAARDIEQRVTSLLTSEELDEFYRVMEKMHAALDDDPEARSRSRMDLVGIKR